MVPQGTSPSCHPGQGLPTKACCVLLPMLEIPFFPRSAQIPWTDPSSNFFLRKKKKDKSIYSWEENCYQNYIHILVLWINAFVLLVIKEKETFFPLCPIYTFCPKYIHMYFFLFFWLLCSVLYFNLYFRSLTLFLLKQSHGLFFHSLMRSFEE